MSVVREKTPPHHYSIVACVLAVGLGMYLWHLGTQNPGKWVASMAVNNHGQRSCTDCHVPTGGRYSFGTTMTCSTSRCHAYLMNDLTSREEAIARGFEAARGYTEGLDAEKLGHLYDLHKAAGPSDNGASCMACHKEHRKDEVNAAEFPPGFGPFQKKAQASAWRSVRDREL
jgi:hypothetical protein